MLILPYLVWHPGVGEVVWLPAVDEAEPALTAGPALAGAELPLFPLPLGGIVKTLSTDRGDLSPTSLVWSFYLKSLVEVNQANISLVVLDRALLDVDEDVWFSLV